jgi:uncharacterized protein with HEPN domain
MEALILLLQELSKVSQKLKVLAHEYFGVDLHIVWGAIHDDLPRLLHTVKQLLENEPV